jgi:N utilization substance protein B
MDIRKIGRRSARKRAFQFVYAMNFREFADKEDVRRAFFELPEDGPDAEVDQKDDRQAEDREFAARLATGVYLWLDELDGLIRRFSKHWRIERIAKTELSILRLAVYEMLHEPDIPLRVSINEAVELSKEFGDEQSFPFVNGILDAVAKAVDHGQLGIHKEF